MTLSTQEIARVEAEVAAFTPNQTTAAAAVADMEARSSATPTGFAFDAWRAEGSVIIRVEESGRSILDSGKPLVGNRFASS